jgi:hypothetical protein
MEKNAIKLLIQTGRLTSPLNSNVREKVVKSPSNLISVMSDTKWDELRLAMYELKATPAWRTKCWENGYISEWDKEWFYHFREGGYELIEWVEIRIESEEQKQKCFLSL